MLLCGIVWMMYNIRDEHITLAHCATWNNHTLFERETLYVFVDI